MINYLNPFRILKIIDKITIAIAHIFPRLGCARPLTSRSHLFPSSCPPRARLKCTVHPAMHSVSDLTTFSRKTSGDVPPKLVVRIIAVCSVYYSFHFSFLLYRAHRPPWLETRSTSTWALLSTLSSVPSILHHVPGRSSRDRTQNGHRYVCL
jgi:hypothetical protein